MRKTSDWKKLLKIEPDFLDLERAILEGGARDYGQIPASAFSLHAWDLIPEARLFDILLPFLKQQLERARLAMPEIYASRLKDIDPGAIQGPDDWYRVPLLVKDDDPQHNLRGFRDLATAKPLVMRPKDCRTASMSFGSGGSAGLHTPTFVSLRDREREVQGWRRGHDYHGLAPGDRALYTYNTTHKGGQWMQESLWAHGVEVQLRRPEEGALQVLENLRKYEANVLFTVQQPYQAMQHQAKAAGINLHTLIMASLEHPHLHGLLIPDKEGHKQIEFVFLGGFEIVPYAMQLVENYLDGTPVATLLGSSEAIPQACSTNPVLTPGGLCHYNHLHLLQGPHYVEVLKAEGQKWVPVEKGEQGLLVYSSWARDGTLWMRYAPGDVATKQLNEGECPCGLYSPVITGVQRKDLQEREKLLVEGCAAG
jgi:phenylacetate-CoA ligase